jgi:hypothetical protein
MLMVLVLIAETVVPLQAQALSGIEGHITKNLFLRVRRW